MHITFLGNGGAINDGLPYNGFLINEDALCEAPPDVMVSLARCRLDARALRTVFISHLHGDHCFGLPFLLLDRFYRSVTGAGLPSLGLFGPAGLAQHMRTLCLLALGKGHPVLDWLEEHVSVTELEPGPGPCFITGCRARYWRMDHPLETLGFLINGKESGRPLLCYSADTLWCPSLAQMLTEKPALAIVDLNGRSDDPHPVHLALQTLQEQGLPLTGTETKYYGTHLKSKIDETEGLISNAEQGLRVTLKET